MSFLERLYLLMESKNVSKNELCKILEINTNSFVNWENRQTLPKGDTLIKMAEYFNVSVDYLLGYAPKMENEEQELIDFFTSLSTEHKKLAISLVKTVLETNK